MRTALPELGRLPSGRHGLPEELVRDYQRRRLLEAAVAVAAEKGFGAMAVADVLAAAGVSRATFYEQFDDKDQCFAAAYELATERLVAAATGGCGGAGEWVARVRAGLAALTALLAAEPALGRMVLVEGPKAGPAGRRRYRAALARFEPLLEEGYGHSEAGSELSAGVARIAVGGAATLIAEAIGGGESKRLERLAPELTFAVLVPFLGPERAAAAAE